MLDNRRSIGSFPAAKRNTAFLAGIIRGALEEVFNLHRTLGPQGLENASKNQFGDSALLLDLKAEETMIEHLKRASVPAKVVSEEHGTFLLNDPKFTVIMDGIDGTSVYKSARNKGRYGTLVGIFETDNPRFDDYLVCGLILHSPKKVLLTGIRGGGVSCEDESGVRTLPSQSAVKQWSELVYHTVDLSPCPQPVRALTGCAQLAVTSMAASFAALALREGDFIVEPTRKKILEQAICYGMLREVGGDIVTLDGESIGKKKYFELGQDDSKPEILVSSHSHKLCLDICERLVKP